jgi:hypothetical protein
MPILILVVNRIFECSRDLYPFGSPFILTWAQILTLCCFYFQESRDNLNFIVRKLNVQKISLETIIITPSIIASLYIKYIEQRIDLSLQISTTSYNEKQENINIFHVLIILSAPLPKELNSYFMCTCTTNLLKYFNNT